MIWYQEGDGQGGRHHRGRLRAGTADVDAGQLRRRQTHANRYRIRLTTLRGPVARGRSRASRSPFPISPPSDANTFYVDDRERRSDDEYTPWPSATTATRATAAGSQGGHPPLVLSYPMGTGDMVLVDTGDYVHAVNLNLAARRSPSTRG